MQGSKNSHYIKIIIKYYIIIVEIFIFNFYEMIHANSKYNIKQTNNQEYENYHWKNNIWKSNSKKLARGLPVWKTLSKQIPYASKILYQF